jgi:hypothetical protein
VKYYPLKPLTEKNSCLRSPQRIFETGLFGVVVVVVFQNIRKIKPFDRTGLCRHTPNSTAQISSQYNGGIFREIDNE